MPNGSSHVPPHLAGLVDEAPAIDPAMRPALDTGTEGVGSALAAHRDRLRSEHADLVGAFVVVDRLLGPLTTAVEDPGAADGAGRAPVLRVRVTGGAGAIAPAVAWSRGTGLSLRGLDLTMRQSDAGDLAPNARRIVAAVDDLLATGEVDADTEVCVEPPPLYGEQPTASWLDALDELAAAEHRLLLRTGTDAREGEATPAIELATCIGAALDREMPLAAAGRLGRAVARRDPTGRLEHGFLNLVVATRANLDGAAATDVVRVLEETDAGALLAGTDPAGLASARRWFTSIRSGRVDDARADLVQLGLLEAR